MAEPFDDDAVESAIVEQARLASSHRLLRGRLGASLRTGKGWRALGYARLGDYCRERLGIAGRTLEEDARVWRALEELPHLLSAFRDSKLSWTKVRLLSSVADRANEMEWIGVALGCDTKSLEERIRRQQQHRLHDAGDSSDADDPRHARPVRFSVSISRHGHRLWRAAREMAERVAGSSLTHAQVLELVAAETASEVPPSRDSRLDAEPLRFEAAWVSAPCFSAKAFHGSDTPVDPFVLDAQLRQIEPAMQRIDSELGRLLLSALEHRTYRRKGFTRFSTYVEERFDICARKAWTLVAIERASAGELASAYREGGLSYLVASALLPVMSSGHAAAWIRRAQEVTLRRLEDEVSWALDRRDSAGTAFDIPAPPPSGCDLHAGKLSVLDDADSVQIRAYGDPATIDVPVDLVLHVPPDVAALAEDVMLTIRHGSESRGSAFERMVAMALFEWMSTPKHRDPVFERDGWRCAVPGCRSRRNLHDHHVVFRSRGGTNVRDNRITVCASHHLHGLHTGRIRASGRAPLGIVWEMPFGKRLLGDRYL